MSRNLSEVYPPREYTAEDIGAVALTGDQSIAGTKNFTGDVQRGGFPIQPLEADLTITVGVGGEPATINGCLAKYSRMYPAYVVGGAIFTLHLPAGFVMAEQVLVNAIDLSHWQITGADAETTIIRSELTTEFEGRYPAFGATNGGRLPLIGQLFNMDTSGTATNRDGVYVQGAGSVANVASACGVKNAGGNGLHARYNGLINANGANFSGATSVCVIAEHVSTINVSNVNASGGLRGIYANFSATINAPNAIATGCGDFGIVATRSSTIDASNANARKGATDSTSDFTVGRLSFIYADGATGGVNQASGTYNNNGCIVK